MLVTRPAETVKNPDNGCPIRSWKSLYNSIIPPTFIPGRALLKPVKPESVVI